MSPANSLLGRSACLIVDDERVTQWQYEALRLCMERGLKIKAVFICTNTRWKRHLLRHFFYYLLARKCHRHRWTRRVPWAGLVGPSMPVHHFASDWEGTWQRIDIDTLGKMAGYGADFVVKFGMYLLRDADAIPATFGVFSFHHGDPSEYRGRPAGFYELLNDASHIGVMVQKIGNRLDAGAVYSFGRCKIFPHSYRATLLNAYANGAHLLHQAFQNAIACNTVPVAITGKNYRLPGNFLVLRFALRLLRNKFGRVCAGAFTEKRWKVAVARPDLPGINGSRALAILKDFAVPAGFLFVADPAILDAETILCEALERSSGKGRIVILKADRACRLDTSALGEGHLSYPHVVRAGDALFLLPEMAQLGGQMLLPIDRDGKPGATRPLRGLEKVRLVDPTLLQHEGRWWLFAGKAGSGSDLLNLWMAEDLEGPYVEHRSSPIVMNPAGARCAGPIRNIGGQLHRFGQDNRRGYGDGVFVHRIVELSVNNYKEEQLGELRVRGAKGPHTVDFLDETIVIDHYRQAFNLFAWLTKLKSRL